MDPATSQEAPRKFGWRTKCAILFATLTLILVLDFAAAQVYKRVCGNPWPSGKPERIYRIPADPYHHGFKPNYSTDTAEWGNTFPVRTNSLGFRDAAVRDVPLQPKGRRIVFIGDSFTEGIGVRWDETFVGRVAAAFAPKGVEVLNAGVGGYSPVIYYRKIRYLVEEKGLKFDELVVAIDSSDCLDELRIYELVDDQVRARGFGPRVAEFIKINSIMVWTFLDHLRPETHRGTGVITVPPAPLLEGDDATIEASLRKQPGVGHIRGAWQHDEQLRQYVEPGVKLMDEYMDRLLALARKHSIAVTVVVYPWPDQILAGDPECVHVRHWRDWCAKNGVAFINTFPKFEIGCPWPRRAEIFTACYIPGDFHLNGEGYRLVAEAILEAAQ